MCTWPFYLGSFPTWYHWGVCKLYWNLLFWLTCHVYHVFERTTNERNAETDLATNSWVQLKVCTMSQRITLLYSKPLISVRLNSSLRSLQTKAVLYLSGFTQTLHSLLVGESLEANPVYLQQSVTCRGDRKAQEYLHFTRPSLSCSILFFPQESIS